MSSPKLNKQIDKAKATVDEMERDKSILTKPVRKRQVVCIQGVHDESMSGIAMRRDNAKESKGVQVG